MKYQSRSFAEQVDKVLSNTFDRANAVYVCGTPKILQDVGLDGNLPMLTTARHIKNANKPKNDKKHHHGLTKEQLKRIPEKIANPVMILDSQNENSIIAVSDMFDEDKLPIIITIKVDGKGMFNNIEVNSNFVTSYYGKDGFNNFIKHSVDRNAFLYINKEKAIALSAESSTQWLEQLKDYDFDIIIRKTNANVNKDTTKFSMRDSGYIETADNNDIRYQYAGRRSETANISMLQKAEEMEHNGVDSETIRKETGWFRGYDKDWRYEIDDRKMKLLFDSYKAMSEANNYYKMWSRFDELLEKKKATKLPKQKLKNLDDWINRCVSICVRRKQGLITISIIPNYLKLIHS